MRVSICIGSACHLKGSREVIQKLQKLVSENHLDRRRMAETPAKREIPGYRGRDRDTEGGRERKGGSMYIREG